LPVDAIDVTGMLFEDQPSPRGVGQVGKVHPFGVEAAIDQQVLTFGHRPLQRRRQDGDTQQRQQRFHCLFSLVAEHRA